MRFMKDNKSATEKVAQYLADLINAAEDREAKRIQKEERFRQSLGIRLQVPKKELEK
ncbi:MAG: hypothetical protein HWD62_16595 [Cyclobacteriaceae bacterium]|nr:MAG: hypothetical protein HWD62_16595 [Cyclobacteriaceae bacterium]